MMRLLHNFFASATAPAPGDTGAAHERLEAAKIHGARCKASLADAQAHVDRVHRVIGDEKTARTALADAEERAAAAAQTWAASGATGASSDAAFADASEIRTKTHRAELLAAGGRAALPTLHEAVADARSALSQAQEKIKNAAVDVLAAEAETHFATLDALMPKVSEAVLTLRGLRAMTSSRLTGFAHDVSGDIASRLAAHGFTAPTAHALDDEEVKLSQREWLLRAHELAKDS